MVGPCGHPGAKEGASSTHALMFWDAWVSTGSSLCLDGLSTAEPDEATPSSAYNFSSQKQPGCEAVCGPAASRTPAPTLPRAGLKAFFTTAQLTPADKVSNAVALGLSPLVRSLFDPEGGMRDIRALDGVSFKVGRNIPGA